MRHLCRLPSLILVLAGLVASRIVQFATNIVPIFHVGASLAFDRLSRIALILPTARSRFMAFANRIGLHDLFIGGGFRLDPGRSLA